MSVQIFVEIKNDSDPQVVERREEEVEKWARESLADIRDVAIEGMTVRADANIDPASVASLAVLLSSFTGAVGAGTALLFALRKMVAEGGALIRAIKVEINGTPRALETVTAEDLDKELHGN